MAQPRLYHDVKKLDFICDLGCPDHSSKVDGDETDGTPVVASSDPPDLNKLPNLPESDDEATSPAEILRQMQGRAAGKRHQPLSESPSPPMSPASKKLRTVGGPSKTYASSEMILDSIEDRGSEVGTRPDIATEVLQHVVTELQALRREVLDLEGSISQLQAESRQNVLSARARQFIQRSSTAVPK